ncbi:hypothetical protein [Xanthobacter agilis]|uniref:Uncharacterized protein n=1 Tax=Xanthobacter agilis TaxID=47492 RepID=A0ABU0LFV0_XANAG|nr:hypothetical protein [Xanthobacter agilis]MDQ0505988.1 hypothetical protein [Xanthobacter agilis]
MNCPDLQVAPMDLASGMARQEGFILGLMLISRHRNGRLERPFELRLSGAGADIARPLTVEDVQAIRDWCDLALAAHGSALYSEAAE